MGRLIDGGVDERLLVKFVALFFVSYIATFRRRVFDVNQVVVFRDNPNLALGTHVAKFDSITVFSL